MQFFRLILLIICWLEKRLDLITLMKKLKIKIFSRNTFCSYNYCYELDKAFTLHEYDLEFHFLSYKSQTSQLTSLQLKRCMYYSPKLMVQVQTGNWTPLYYERGKRNILWALKCIRYIGSWKFFQRRIHIVVWLIKDYLTVKKLYLNLNEDTIFSFKFFSSISLLNIQLNKRATYR